MDRTKQSAGREQLRELRSALQQRVEECAAWLAYSKEVAKRKRRLIDCRFFQTAVGAWMKKSLRESFCDLATVLKTHC